MHHPQDKIIVHCSKHFHHGRFSCDVDDPMRHPLCRVMHTFLPTEPVKIGVRSCKTTSLAYPWSRWPTAHAFFPGRTVVPCGPPLTGGVRVHREKPAARCRVQVSDREDPANHTGPASCVPSGNGR